MTYQQQLFDWIVLREVSPCKWIILSEFRRRNDADNYYQIVAKLFSGRIEVVFRNRLAEFEVQS